MSKLILLLLQSYAIILLLHKTYQYDWGYTIALLYLHSITAIMNSSEHQRAKNSICCFILYHLQPFQFHPSNYRYTYAIMM